MFFIFSLKYDKILKEIRLRLGEGDGVFVVDAPDPKLIFSELDNIVFADMLYQIAVGVFFALLTFALRYTVYNSKKNAQAPATTDANKLQSKAI